MNTVLNDLRFAARGLRKTPAFTLAAMLTLALGIGANASAFGVLNALLYRPPAEIGDPESLFRVRILGPTSDPDPVQGVRPWITSYPEYADLRDGVAGLAELSAYRHRNVIYGRGDEAYEIPALSVSGNYFSTLGTRPALGRFFGPKDEEAGEPAVVLGYDLWRRAFGADPEVIGRTIEISALPVTVIGVAPRHFKGIDLDPVDLWVPLHLETRLGAANLLEARNTTWLWMVGRLRPGTAPAVVAVRATDIVRAVALAHPEAYAAGPDARVDLAPVTDSFAGYGRASPVPLWLLGVTAVVLLIACANASNLILARAARRRRELAIRAAVGASRGRLVQLLMTESLLLASLGVVAGLLLATWSARLLHLLDIPPLDPLIDLRVLLITFVVALSTSVLVGLLPALRSSSADVESELKAATPRATYDRSRVRGTLTVAQVALSIVLLVNAGLFIRSLRNLAATNPGLDRDRVAVIAMRFHRGTPAERTWAVKEEGLQRLRTMPGVIAAELTTGAPFVTGLGRERLDPVSLGMPADAIVTAAPLWVGPDYFGTVGLQLLGGRGFDSSDQIGSPPVIVINAAMAGILGGEAAALGRCLPSGAACAEVVGIVGDSRFWDPSDEPQPAIYHALAQDQRPVITSMARLLIRTDRPATELTSSIRSEMTALAPELQYVEVQSMTELLRPRLQPWNIAMMIFVLFGGVAFLLAAVGLYGVIAYLVAARTAEIGIRIALGATRRRILVLVVGEGVRLVIMGAVCGLLLAIGVAHLLEHRMYGVSPTDPLTYAGVALLMVALALGSTLMSAQRAASLDPNRALRVE